MCSTDLLQHFEFSAKSSATQNYSKLPKSDQKLFQATKKRPKIIGSYQKRPKFKNIFSIKILQI
jgi:hypothetical protein